MYVTKRWRFLFFESITDTCHAMPCHAIRIKYTHSIVSKRQSSLGSSLPSQSRPNAERSVASCCQYRTARTRDQARHPLATTSSTLGGTKALLGTAPSHLVSGRGQKVLRTNKEMVGNVMMMMSTSTCLVR